MELWTSLRVLLRRWYLVLPCVAVTVLVAVQLAGQVTPTYKAEGTVVFLRPLQQGGTSTDPNNPWQSVDYSLNQFALLMGQAAASDAFKDRVAADGGAPTFSVTTSATQAQGSPTNQTPTLTLSAVADTPETAMASYAVLGHALDQEVEDRQRSVGAAESTWITVVDLTVPPGAVEQVGSRVTVLIAVGIAGMLASLGVVFALDAVLLARRHRRASVDDERGDIDLTTADADAADEADLAELAEQDPEEIAVPRRPVIAAVDAPVRHDDDRDEDVDDPRVDEAVGR